MGIFEIRIIVAAGAACEAEPEPVKLHLEAFFRALSPLNENMQARNERKEKLPLQALPSNWCSAVDTRQHIRLLLNTAVGSRRNAARADVLRPRKMTCRDRGIQSNFRRKNSNKTFTDF